MVSTYRESGSNVFPIERVYKSSIIMNACSESRPPRMSFFALKRRAAIGLGIWVVGLVFGKSVLEALAGDGTVTDHQSRGLYASSIELDADEC